MAYENLRAAITQNIKTNNQEEITGAIMQQILLQMVSELGAWDSTLSGFATTQWVQEQLNGYVSQAALSNYLPLTGGTMTGGIASGSLDTGYYFLSNELMKFEYSYNGNPRYAGGIEINVKNSTITWYGRGGQSNGTEITGGSVTSGSFKVQNGTSSQFLKADGSVDSNAYLPLTGGTLTGWLYFNSSDYKIGYYTAPGEPSLLINSENHIELAAGGNIDLETDNVYCLGSIHATSFIKDGGTSEQVLCADGSVKTLSELKAALDAL